MVQPSSSPAPAAKATLLNPSQRQIHQMLATYIATIRRDDFVPRLNKLLQSRASSSAGSATADIQAYYADRPELRNYTLGVELDRDLDYTLVLKDGRSITDKLAIRSHFSAGKNNEKPAKKGNRTAVNTEELLIRAANQSLLADAFIALTGSEEVLQPPIQNKERKPGLILSGPILSMGSVVEKCHFTIDLKRGMVEAICVLAISVPDENRRLVLARAILIANFRPGKKGQLQYAMQLVKAHHFPASRTLRDAAISLAKDQESLLLQSGHENPATKNDARPQRSFSLFR